MTKRQYLSAFVGLVFALIMAQAVAAQQADIVAAKRLEAGTLFWQGKVRQGVEILRSAIPTTPAVSDKLLLAYNMLEMCGMSEDWACLHQTIPEMARLIGSEHDFDRYRWPLAAYRLNLAVWERNDAEIEQFLASSSAAILSDPAGDPGSVALAQLALHDWFARKDRLIEAERSLSAAISALLAMDTRSNQYRVAEVLMRLMRSLRYGNDVAGAVNVAVRAEPFIERFVPGGSVLYSDMMLELAEQSTYLTTYPAVAARFVAVFHSIEQLDISDERKGERLAIANSTACAALVLASKLEEAKALHMRHPVFARKDAILRRGSFAGYAEFYFAVTDIFLAGVGGTPPDPRWIPVFEKQPDWKMDDAARREFDAFRDFARGILAASGGNAMEGARLVKHAAWERIHSYDVALRRGFEGFPLPSMLDQIILALGLSVATRVQEQDGPELMLAGSELVNRSLHHGVVDAAVLLDSQSDQATRHDAHEYIQLLRRKRAWELDQISHMLNEDSPSGEDRGSTLRHYSEMAAKLDRLKDVLRRNPRLMPAKGLPTIGDLSRSLAPGSAYVTYFLAPPSFGKLCITRDGAYWALGTFGPQTASDVKLLAFATTASYPPNPRLDAQFPVSSALRLHDLLFGGLGGCLRPGMHVTVSLPTMFPGIPLGALLQQEPPRSGDGYELAKAHWMIRDFSFALVHSAREFLATTSYLRTSLARRPYLGIGDPKLDRPQLAKVASKATFRGTAVAPNGLADLRELPETAEELKSVGALFESADILIGEGATEAALRAKPLADYAVIHFATHGLIRDELAGLTEPALVLTPSGSADAKRDGLLLASEIFDLTLNARLVVLSACNTAKYDLGQATLVAQDLRTAFTVAGAPTLLVSLWPVDSATSRDLMVGFFRQWRSPQAAGAADALARATRAYLAQADAPHQHPRFWAPFVVAGNGGVRGLPDVPASASARRGQGVGRQ